jgi:hypothetical protein
MRGETGSDAVLPVERLLEIVGRPPVIRLLPCRPP